jgi:VIT1/CCC1 family predicted Fe2+/Mn2+ transporter
MTALGTTGIERPAREPVLDLVDRVCELLFGLFMALTFVGAVSVAESGRAELRTMFISALGCNIAWGLVDAVMYVVRAVTARGRSITLVTAVRAAAQPEAGRQLLRQSLSPIVAQLITDPALEDMREGVVALPHVPDRPRLELRDGLAALGIFLIVVASTFPVVLPFAVLQDVGVAKMVSRVIALLMLFAGGLALGRHAGYGSWKVGFMMAGLGAALVAAVMALGG